MAHGAKVNSRDKHGRTPLHLAVMADRLEVAKLLLAHGADVDAKDRLLGQTPLQHAASICTIPKGAYSIVFGPSSVPLTPKDRLAQFSHPEELLKILVSAGADLSVKDDQGRTVLHWAAFWGYTDVAETLVSKGADVNARTVYGETPLHLAARAGQTDMVELLRKHGATE